MCQVGEYTFEITFDVVNMVERRTTQSENVKELRFSKNIGWSQFAYLKLRKTRSGFSIPLDFEIAKVACISKLTTVADLVINFAFYQHLYNYLGIYNMLVHFDESYLMPCVISCVCCCPKQDYCVVHCALSHSCTIGCNQHTYQ